MIDFSEEFLNEAIMDTTKEQISKKLKVLNQSFRYVSFVDSCWTSISLSLTELVIR